MNPPSEGKALSITLNSSIAAALSRGEGPEEINIREIGDAVVAQLRAAAEAAPEGGNAAVRKIDASWNKQLTAEGGRAVRGLCAAYPGVMEVNMYSSSVPGDVKAEIKKICVARGGGDSDLYYD